MGSIKAQNFSFQPLRPALASLFLGERMSPLLGFSLMFIIGWWEVSTNACDPWGDALWPCNPVFLAGRSIGSHILHFCSPFWQLKQESSSFGKFGNVCLNCQLVRLWGTLSLSSGLRAEYAGSWLQVWTGNLNLSTPLRQMAHRGGLAL